MSNQPLFDDEDLPAWLRNAGITYGGTGNQTAPSSPPPSTNDDLSWLDEGGQATSSGSLPFDAGLPWDGSAPDENASFDTIPDAPDWMQGLESAPSSGESAPWMQNTAPTASVPDVAPSDSASLPWEQASAADEGSASSAGFGMTGALPWRQGVSDPADQPAETVDNDLDWMGAAPADEVVSAASEDLAPWQNQREAEAAPASSADDLSWMDAGPPTLPKPPTSEATEVTADDLNWLNEPAATTEAPIDEPVSQAQGEADLGWLSEPAVMTEAPLDEPVSEAAVEDDLGWLSEPAAATEAPLDEPVSEAPVEADLGWLSEPAAATEAPPEEPMTQAPVEPVEAPKPALKRLPSMQKDAPPAEAPKPAAIRKLPSANQPPAEPPRPAAIKKLPTSPAAPPPPDYSNMTYEEWDQAQTNQGVPADQAIDEVPDWFKSADAPADSDTEYTPDWYGGEQEPAAEAAPDWFSTDFSNTPLVGPDSIQNQTIAPEPVAPTSDDAPDWFKGAASGVDDIDFNSMFVAETPVEEPKSTGSLAAKLAEMTPEAPSIDIPDAVAPAELESVEDSIEAVVPEEVIAPVEPEPIAEIDDQPVAEVTAPTQDDADLDWMDMPDLDDLTGSSEPLAVSDEAVAAPESAESEVADESIPVIADNMLDWLNTPAEDAVATVEPQAGLVSDVQDEAELAPGDGIPDWMAQSVAQPTGVSATVEPDSPDMLAQDFASVADMSAAVEPEAEIVPGDDIPDWMAQSVAEPTGVSAAVEPETIDDSLDWMGQDIAPATEMSASIEPEAELAPADDIPDWMTQDFAPSAETTIAAEPEADLAHAEDISDWMSEMAAEPSLDASSAAEPLADLTPVGDAPDWMREMAAEPSTSVEPLADLAPAEDMPDWMGQMAQGSSAEMSEDPLADLAPAGDVPDWMREMATESSGNISEPEADLAPAEDMPDWMRQMADGSAAPVSASAEIPMHVEPIEGAQDFDWLTDFDASGSAPVEATSQAEAPSAEAVPTQTEPAHVDIDALLNFADTTAVPEPQMTSAEPAEPTVDEFDFESELEPIIPAEPAAPSEEQFDASTLDFDALMAATAEAQPIEPAEPAQPEPAAAPAGPSPRLRRLPKTGEMPAVPASAVETAPEMVEIMQQTTGPVVLRIGDQVVRAEERPANILPDDLQRLRERAKAFAQRSAVAPAATSAGPLAGITGAIDAIPEPVQPVTSAGAASLIISDLDARRIKIIQSILGGEEEMLEERLMGDEERQAKQAAAGIKPAAPARPRPKIDRIIITILLAAVIVAPFFTGVLNITTLPDMTQLSVTQASVKDAVDAIPADQEVLVAFEYGPTGAGELDDLARVIVRDIVKRGAHPVIVSTNPTGALHAQFVMQSLATRPDDLSLMNRANKPLIVRQDYWVLPYLPGGAIGVHSLLNAVLNNNAAQLQFRTDIEGQPTGLTNVSINTLQRNPAFILTESQEDVRNWVEQYQTAAPNQVKLVLLSSAAASAVAQTYVNSASDKHLIGPLVGLRDAMTYQAVRQPLPTGTATTQSDQRWQSIGIGTLLATLLILAGAAYNVIRGLQRRTRR